VRPSYKTLWHRLNVTVKAEGLIVIHEALMNAIREAFGFLVTYKMSALWVLYFLVTV